MRRSIIQKACDVEEDPSTVHKGGMSRHEQEIYGGDTKRWEISGMPYYISESVVLASYERGLRDKR